MGCSHSIQHAAPDALPSLPCDVLPHERAAAVTAAKYFRLSGEHANNLDFKTFRRQLRNDLKRFPCIPHAYRWFVYQHLSGGLELQRHYSGLYRTLLKLGPNHDVDMVIRHDAHRTMPYMPFFGPRSRPGPGQSQLYRILTAYSHLDPATGYTQGQNFIVAMLLLSGLNEETGFYVFSGLMIRFGLRLFYLSGLPLAIRAHQALDELLRRKKPKLHAHLQENGIFPALYSTPWLLSMFVSSPLPPSTIFVILDRLLLETDAADIAPIFAESYQTALTHTQINGRGHRHVPTDEVDRILGRQAEAAPATGPGKRARLCQLHRGSPATTATASDLHTTVGDLPRAYLRACLVLVGIHEKALLGEGDPDGLYRCIKDEYTPFPWRAVVPEAPPDAVTGMVAGTLSPSIIDPEHCGETDRQNGDCDTLPDTHRANSAAVSGERDFTEKSPLSTMHPSSTVSAPAVVHVEAAWVNDHSTTASPDEQAEALSAGVRAPLSLRGVKSRSPGIDASSGLLHSSPLSDRHIVIVGADSASELPPPSEPAAPLDATPLPGSADLAAATLASSHPNQRSPVPALHLGFAAFSQLQGALMRRSILGRAATARAVEAADGADKPCSGADAARLQRMPSAPVLVESLNATHATPIFNLKPERRLADFGSATSFRVMRGTPVKAAHEVEPDLLPVSESEGTTHSSAESDEEGPAKPGIPDDGDAVAGLFNQAALMHATPTNADQAGAALPQSAGAPSSSVRAASVSLPHGPSHNGSVKLPTDGSQKGPAAQSRQSVESANQPPPLLPVIPRKKAMFIASTGLKVVIPGVERDINIPNATVTPIEAGALAWKGDAMPQMELSPSPPGESSPSTEADGASASPDTRYSSWSCDGLPCSRWALPSEFAAVLQSPAYHISRKEMRKVGQAVARAEAPTTNRLLCR